MKKKWIFLSICVLGILVFSCFSLTQFTRKDSSKELRHAKNKYSSYFESVSIPKFSPGLAPYLPAQIDNTITLVKLDLGFRGNFSFTEDFLEKLEKKTYMQSRLMYGFRGNEYEMKIYRVPEIKIGRMAFSQPTLLEDSQQSRKDSVIMQETQDSVARESGRVGWELFRSVNLFLDLGNSKIAFCDGLSSLKSQGYPVEIFTKTPLLLERGLVEFEALTPDGVLRCVLDTGATWNILNTALEEGKSIEQMAKDPSNTSQISVFKINEKNFGPVMFHHLPVRLPIRIEAILGMEFFLNHFVFLDFAENLIYFAPKAKDP